MLWDFGAETCIRCKKMAPILEQMSEEYKDRLTGKFTEVWKPENIKTKKDNGIVLLPRQLFVETTGNKLCRHAGEIKNTEIVSIEDALKYCGATQQQGKQNAMLSNLRSDNVIVTDTKPSHMHSALISEYMALKRSGMF